MLTFYGHEIEILVENVLDRNNRPIDHGPYHSSSPLEPRISALLIHER
jgi:hypothetical protein